jgi:hypothetical protein
MALQNFQRLLEVSLSVDCIELSSIEIKTILDIEPDKQWNVGDAFQLTSNSPVYQRQFSRWSVSASADSADDLNEITLLLLSRVKNKQQNFLKLPLKTQILLTFFITEIDSVFSIGIDKSIVDFLGSISCGVEFSFVLNQELSAAQTK